ncbi:MAG: hypothetical protein QM784_37165 [Polyangiaceae bacterium]
MFASWEPLAEQIPAVSDPKEARAMVALSRRYWRFVQEYEPRWHDSVNADEKAPLPRYSYVRANQIAKDRVQFTILSVEGGRVVARGLTEMDPNDLESTANDVHSRLILPKTLYRELGSELGTHDDGFPLLTIDDLYDQCEREIARSDSDPIQLYFHPSGVLMQCGRARSHCSDCASLSIQTYSMNPLGPYTKEFEPTRWACIDHIGLILPGTATWTQALQYQCAPPELAKERIRRLSDPVAYLWSSRDSYCGDHCDWPYLFRVIDPCPIFPARPSFLEVGKPHPEARYVVRGDGLNPECSSSRSVLQTSVTRRQDVPTLKDRESRASNANRRETPPARKSDVR